MKKSQAGALGCDALLLLLDVFRVINNFLGCLARSRLARMGFGRLVVLVGFSEPPVFDGIPVNRPTRPNVQTVEGACWRPPLLGCWRSLLEDLQPGQGDGAVAGMVEFHADAASAQGGLNFLEPLAQRMR